ncbi:NADH dehydrogenase FAD-containing subunit [Halobacteriales archaeon QH_10_67_13]|nr:MAG: NADH dehydrogenase FAD-containing subunit [Halobacteriales archaeon QH_10_67_13]
MHVAVLGAGYAGLALTRQLERSLPADVRLTLVDETDYHLAQHLLHTTIGKPKLADELTIELSAALDRAEHRQAHVTGLDPDDGVAELENGQLSYDVGALTIGAETAFHGVSGAAEHGTPLKRLSHAHAIRERFGELTADQRAVVVGGGLSGVQVAGELAALAADRDGNGEKEETGPTVLLVERSQTVAPGFSAEFQSAVRAALLDAGVEVRTGWDVTEVTPDRLGLADGGSVGHDQLVWTGGIAGDRAVGDRPRVRADLRLGERTLGLGDAVRVVDANGRLVPASAQTAVRQADVAATNVRRLLADNAPAPSLERYRYTGLGWLVSVGEETVAQVGPTVLRGPAAKAVKTSVGTGYLGSIGAWDSAAEYARTVLWPN